MAPYRAGLKTRELGKWEIGEMLKLRDIDPVETEWATLVVVAPEND